VAVRNVIRIGGVTKTYVMGATEVHALAGVDLTVDEGEMVAVMGASGSGKSTLMNVIGCLDTPTGGVYELDGVRVDNLDRNRLADIRNQRIGFVFQGFNLLARTTALENTELPLIYKRVPAEERHHRAMQALAIVGLEGREHHTPSELSGGQQQRVAIARALVVDPALLLADEPTGNLDSARSAEVMKLLVQLNRERGLTIVMVTHEPDLAAYGSRIVTFKDGRILDDQLTGGRS
jgi:putative ABC transport system ATP-binding protein